MRPVTDDLALSSDELKQRVLSYSYVFYSNFQFLIKSGVFTVSSLTLIDILSVQTTRLETIERLSFWLASMSFSLVTLGTWNRGAMLSNGKINAFDNLLTFVMGVIEYAMFIIISPRVAPGFLWHWWYLFFFLHSALAVALIWNRMLQTCVTRDFVTELQALGDKYIKWLKSDIIGAASVAAVALVIFITTRSGHWLKTPDAVWFHIACGAVFAGLGGMVVFMTANQYKKTVRFLEKTLRAKAA